MILNRFNQTCDDENRRGERAWLGRAVMWSLLCACLLGGGCSKKGTRFEVVSVSEERGSERISEEFAPGSFAVDAQGKWDIVFEIEPVRVVNETPDDEMPDDELERPEQEEQDLWWSQIIHAHLFWNAKPGTTYAESSQTNATIVYCIMTNYGVVEYKGGGFVYFEKSRDGKTIEGEIESSTLYPSRFVGEPADVFGRCRLRGTFKAKADRGHVVSVQRRLRKRLGPPTITDPVEIQP